MTIEQITAINNGMSMIANLENVCMIAESIKEFKEYTDRHITALKDSGVDINIVEHFESLCHSYLPLAENAVRQHKEYIAQMESYSSL